MTQVILSLSGRHRTLHVTGATGAQALQPQSGHLFARSHSLRTSRSLSDADGESTFVESDSKFKFPAKLSRDTRVSLGEIDGIA